MMMVITMSLYLMYRAEELNHISNWWLVGDLRCRTPKSLTHADSNLSQFKLVYYFFFAALP